MNTGAILSSTCVLYDGAWSVRNVMLENFAVLAPSTPFTAHDGAFTERHPLTLTTRLSPLIRFRPNEPGYTVTATPVRRLRLDRGRLNQ